MKPSRLEKFLINRNLLEAFKYNLEHHRIYRGYANIHSLIIHIYPPDLIEGAFRWSYTSEGRNFWIDVNSEWKVSLKNNTL